MDEFGRTPLDYNAEYSHENSANNQGADITLELIKHGADVNAKIKTGAYINGSYCGEQTPLFNALRCGNITIVHTLLEHGADVTLSDEFGRTPLHYYAEYSHENSANQSDDITLELIKHGADVNARTHWGQTTLFPAVRCGNIAILRTLLENSADVKLSEKWRQCTVLHEAADRGDLKAISLLIEYGATVDAPDKDGRTPLHEAAKAGKTHEAFFLLIKAGANVHAKNNMGMTPAFLAGMQTVPHPTITDWVLQHRQKEWEALTTLVEKTASRPMP
jgi:ankyrin repeat protein